MNNNVTLKTVEDVKNFYNNLDEDQKSGVWHGMAHMAKENAYMKAGIAITAIGGGLFLIGRKIVKRIKNKKNKKRNSNVIDV